MILGTEFNDRIYAQAGNDTVNGGLGDGSIYGSRGADRLEGGEGVDFIIGAMAMTPSIYGMPPSFPPIRMSMPMVVTATTPYTPMTAKEI